jgi:hypothetical protein
MILLRRGFGGRISGIIEPCLEYNYRRGAALPSRGDVGPLRRQEMSDQNYTTSFAVDELPEKEKIVNGICID